MLALVTKFLNSSKNVMFTILITALNMAFFFAPRYTPIGAKPEVHLPLISGDLYIMAMLSLAGLFVTGKGLEYGLKKED